MAGSALVEWIAWVAVLLAALLAARAAAKAANVAAGAATTVAAREVPWVIRSVMNVMVVQVRVTDYLPRNVAWMMPHLGRLQNPPTASECSALDLPPRPERLQLHAARLQHGVSRQRRAFASPRSLCLQRPVLAAADKSLQTRQTRQACSSPFL